MSGEPWFAHSCRDGVRMWSDPDGEDPEWRMSVTLDGDCPARTCTGYAEVDVHGARFCPFCGADMPGRAPDGRG